MPISVETSVPPANFPAPPPWTLRIARSSANGQSPTVDSLRDVPKPLLKTVFGELLGQRIWEQTRAGNSQAASTFGHPIGDAEISGGLIEFVSRQAATALRSRGRNAQAIGLTIRYADGTSEIIRTRLGKPTNDAAELAWAAAILLPRVSASGATVQSVDLAVTSVEAVAVPSGRTN